MRSLSIAAIVFALVATGTTVGFTFGHRFAINNKPAEPAVIKEPVVKLVVDKSAAAELKKARQEIERLKAKSAQPVARPEKHINQDVLEFIDSPHKFMDRTITARIRYGPRDVARRAKMSLQEIRANIMASKWDTDTEGNGVVSFHGDGPNHAKLDLRIGIPPNMETPNADLDDELIITFKCGASATFGNVATKMVRPK